MKKRKLLCLLMVLSLVTMPACGDGDIPLLGLSQTESVESPVEVIVEPLGTAAPEVEEVTTMQELEERFAAGIFTAADYKVLAKYYTEENRNKEARDALELSYQMEQNEEVYASLQGLTVNAAEEEAMAQQLDLLIMNLNTPEYANESISMLFTDEWFQAMMPQLQTGKRSYYREKGDTILYLEVGYNEQQQKYTSIWKKTGDVLQVIQQTPGTLQSVVTGVEDSKYHGKFESWTCIAPTGDIFHETGTFDRGVVVGDYTAEVRWGKDSADIMALWTMREDMEFDTYTGTFAENGMTTVTQPTVEQQSVINGEQNGDNAVIYAYSEDGKNYLFMSRPSNTIFTCDVIGLQAYPSFDLYEPVQAGGSTGIDLTERKIALSDLQVRIYNGNIEVYDGTKWLVMGSVEEYQAEGTFVKAYVPKEIYMQLFREE